MAGVGVGRDEGRPRGGLAAIATKSGNTLFVFVACPQKELPCWSES